MRVKQAVTVAAVLGASFGSLETSGSASNATDSDAGSTSTAGPNTSSLSKIFGRKGGSSSGGGGGRGGGGRSGKSGKKVDGSSEDRPACTSAPLPATSTTIIVTPSIHNGTTVTPTATATSTPTVDPKACPTSKSDGRSTYGGAGALTAALAASALTAGVVGL